MPFHSSSSFFLFQKLIYFFSSLPFTAGWSAASTPGPLVTPLCGGLFSRLVNYYLNYYSIIIQLLFKMIQICFDNKSLYKVVQNLLMVDFSCGLEGSMLEAGAFRRQLNSFCATLSLTHPIISFFCSSDRMLNTSLNTFILEHNEAGEMTDTNREAKFYIKIVE